MKKFLVIAMVALSFTVTAPSSASDLSPEISPEEAIKNVEAFYMELQKKMNESDYDTALSIINERFAEDFLHYDDGEVSYGKDGMILFVENHKEAKVRTRMDIDIINTSYDSEKSEVLTKFNISQKFYKRSEDNNEEYEDTGARIYLTCSDSLRVQDQDDFELYKCDCITKQSGETVEKQADTDSQPAQNDK